MLQAYSSNATMATTMWHGGIHAHPHGIPLSVTWPKTDTPQQEKEEIPQQEAL